MSMVNPLRDGLDHITLNGVPSPGVAVVSGAERAAKWDEQAGQGASGATLTYGGRELAEVTVAFELWEEIHFVQWDAFKTFLEPPALVGANAKPTAMQLHHPLVDEIGANAVVFVSRTQLTQEGEGGKWVCTAKFKEYLPPKPILGNANASGTADIPKPDDLLTPDADIDDLRRQVQELKAEDAKIE